MVQQGAEDPGSCTLRTRYVGIPGGESPAKEIQNSRSPIFSYSTIVHITILRIRPTM